MRKENQRFLFSYRKRANIWKTGQNSIVHLSVNMFSIDKCILLALKIKLYTNTRFDQCTIHKKEKNSKKTNTAKST